MAHCLHRWLERWREDRGKFGYREVGVSKVLPNSPAAQWGAWIPHLGHHTTAADLNRAVGKGGEKQAQEQVSRLNTGRPGIAMRHVVSVQRAKTGSVSTAPHWRRARLSIPKMVAPIQLDLCVPLAMFLVTRATEAQ